MNKTFHRRFNLITLATCGLVMFQGVIVAQAADIQANYFGRWTVKDENPVFSAKGQLYKTIDIAPCGADFCGVSVNDKGSCGPTLFRFLMSHFKNTSLTGHGKWGDDKKKIMIQYWLEEESPVVMIGLGGDSYDIESREGSMATFEAQYKRDGDAKCGANSARADGLDDEIRTN